MKLIPKHLLGNLLQNVSKRMLLTFSDFNKKASKVKRIQLDIPQYNRNETIGANLERFVKHELKLKERQLQKRAEEVAAQSKKGLSPIYEEGKIVGYAPYRLALSANDKPLSGADPIGEFYVSTVALNPIFKGIGKAGKWLLEGNTGKAISLGVRKVTSNDGKIFLQLPSHSKKMPRLLRIEPLGDNTFRVHISTWGGITDAEKKELYDALYNTLPENARILFPESSANYLATRGTVAGLKRLGRDPRFTPGKTKQTLMYRDKDGSIKIFEGTDFVKSPRTLASLNTDLASKHPGLKVLGADKAATNDIKAMNKYHGSNVAEYNAATGSNVKSVPFREDYTASQTKILPDDEFNTIARQKKTNSPNGDVRSIGGMYSRADDITYLRTRTPPSNAYHEFLHRGNYGITNPEVTEWRIQLIVDPELTKGMSEASKKYYLSANEFPVHLRQQGENMSIKVGQEFPGEEVFNRMIENGLWGGASLFSKGRSIGSSLEDKKLLWRALNGTLFGGAVPIYINALKPSYIK